MSASTGYREQRLSYLVCEHFRLDPCQGKDAVSAKHGPMDWIALVKWLLIGMVAMAGIASGAVGAMAWLLNHPKD